MYTCEVCGKEKKVYINKSAKSGLRSPQCYFCQTLRLHNITFNDYSELFYTQKGLCPICKKSLNDSKICIDHDHGCCEGRYSCGDCIRGLLCLSCNFAIGHLGDDLKRIHRAASYLTGTKIFLLEKSML